MKIDKRNHLTTRLAYIAGFIDGEGCIRIKRCNKGGNSYYITLHATNSDREPLEMIQTILGGKIFYQEKSRNKTIWQYYITCSEAADALRTLEGFLKSKKLQANTAIYFHDNKNSMSKEDKLWYYNMLRYLKGRKIKNPELLEAK